MAIDVTLSVRLDTKIGGVRIPYNPSRITYTLSEDDLESGIWEVGASEEDLDIGDVTTEGLLLLHSLEATGGNDVIYGPKDGGGNMVTFGRLYPGRIAVMEIDTTVTVRAKSSAGTVRVYHQLLSK